MFFVREMDSVELAISPALELSQKTLAIEDSFVNFVGKIENISQECYFCDSLKQSIKLSFCGTS